MLASFQSRYKIVNLARPFRLRTLTVAPWGHIRPKVPTSLQVLSSPVIPLVSVPGCLPTDYGIAIGTTYQVQDQDGNALKSGSMEPQEKLLNLVLNGSEPINPIPNWWIYGTRLGLEVQSSRMPTGNSWMPIRGLYK